MKQAETVSKVDLFNATALDLEEEDDEEVY